jgi:hypothetical protein
MVDNVTLPGTGEVIASDDVSGVQYQRVKLVVSTDGSSQALTVAEDTPHTTGDQGIAAMAVRKDQPVNLSNADGDYDHLQVSNGALWVSPLGFPKTVKVDVTRPADTTAYAAGDAMSNSTTAPTTGGFTITDAARKSGGSGLITDVCVASSNDPGTRLNGEIYFWDQSVTNINDNAAFQVTDAEIKNCLGVVPFSLYDAGNNHYAHITGLNILFTCVGSANLRFLIRVRAAYTPANAEVLSFTFKILQLD